MHLHPQKIKFKILRNEKGAITKESKGGTEGRRKEKKTIYISKLIFIYILNAS